MEALPRSPRSPRMPWAQRWVRNSRRRLEFFTPRPEPFRPEIARSWSQVRFSEDRGGMAWEHSLFFGGSSLLLWTLLGAPLDISRGTSRHFSGQFCWTVAWPLSSAVHNGCKIKADPESPAWTNRGPARLLHNAHGGLFFLQRIRYLPVAAVARKLRGLRQ